MNLFAEEIEQQAIERIQKFAKIAKTMGFEVCLGFSGGKDSQVCYDLCKRSGIEFKAYYICRWLNHSFMPFTKKQEEFYRKVREKYDQLKSNKSNKK